MKLIPVLCSSFVLAVGASALTQVALRPAPVATGALPVEAGPVRAQLEELALAVESLEQRLSQLAARPATVPGGRRSGLDLESAIADYLARHHPGLAEVQPARVEPAAAAAGSVDELLAQLLVPDLAWDERRSIFEAARESGQLDALVEALVARADTMPNSAEAQLGAGTAFLERLYGVPDGPEKGLLATSADKYFDRALEIDPRHWEARFTKAVSLSFWPPLFGKQAEAIQHFEILVEQQANQPLADHHAQTYELLGNLYHQSGELEKAASIRRTGRELFPGVEPLDQQQLVLGQ